MNTCNAAYIFDDEFLISFQQCLLTSQNRQFLENLLLVQIVFDIVCGWCGEVQCSASRHSKVSRVTGSKPRYSLRVSDQLYLLAHNLIMIIQMAL